MLNTKDGNYFYHAYCFKLKLICIAHVNLLLNLNINTLYTSIAKYN